MNGYRLAGVLLAMLMAAPASAQVFFGPSGFGVVNGGGFSFNYHSRHLTFSAFSARSFYATSSYYAPFPFVPFPYYAPPVYFEPPPIFIPPPIIIQQPIIVQAKGEETVDVPKGLDPNRFIVIRPNNDPLPLQLPKKLKEVELGVMPAEFPVARGNAVNPMVEADRRLELGLAAFGEARYGQALEHFRHAATVAPDDSAAFFYMAQAQFAIGKYDAAAASLTQGLKLRPDWPKTRFRTRDLYRDKPEAFTEQLRQLREAQKRDPEDARLSFVLGVQLWFDGRREEAREFFEQARKTIKDPTPIQAFGN